MFQRKFGVSLEIKDFGFHSLASFVANCPSIDFAPVYDHCLIFALNWGDELKDQSYDVEELDFPAENVSIAPVVTQSNSTFCT